MAWVVDTCLVIDVLDGDALFGRDSALLLDKMVSQDLLLSPISYVELAPAFLGDANRQNQFLHDIGVQYTVSWEWRDTRLAHEAWMRYVALRREGKTRRRPVADILIGAFAVSHRGLLTRNPHDFTKIFPRLDIRVPG